MNAGSAYVAAAAAVLAGHAAYAWNKAGTRIRCHGEECGTVLEAPGGEDEAVLAFALHQAEQLPAHEHSTPTETPAKVDAPPAARPELTPDAVEQDETAGASEPTAAGDQMETAVTEHAPDTKPAPKFRRDTKSLTATIAQIKKGDRVTASFNHPRYGEFTVEGTVLKGGTGLDRNQLIVGGWYINLNERAAKHLQGLTIVAPAGQHEFDIPKASELTEHIGIGG